MRHLVRRTLFRTAASILAGVMALGSVPAGWAASHREAPLIALDPTADITDVYAFRSWEDAGKAVFIMNVIPSQVPASGPNFFNFDDDVVYAFNFDMDRDGRADDAVVEFRFSTALRPPFDDLPIAYAGVDPVPGLPPAITALDGPGSEGLGLRQRYSIRVLIKQAGGQQVVAAETNTADGGAPLIAVPSNVGARTMPDYAGLAAKGVYTVTLAGVLPVRVFAGQRKETFSIDLASTFDTLNFRRNPPVLTDAEDANDGVNPFGTNDFVGLNVNTIALELPVGAMPPTIGVYASTSRPGPQPGQTVQVARMGNPLVNELIIGTGAKDLWNATDPADEAQFLGFYQTPRLAALLNLAFGIAVPPTPRGDLVSALLQYPTGGILSDLLRVDLSVPPTHPLTQRRLGPLAHDAAGNPTPDPAGWPNGRRPNDDVTDVALRVVAGVLSGDSCCAGAPYNRLGDGVNVSAVPSGTPDVTANGISTKFPFLPIPLAGRR
jgi:hypothetical protein